MKKVLLGLLALSATLMASTTTPPSTGVTGTAGNNQIDITTKAFIVDSGLIITESESGTNAIKSIELDHGTIMKTNTAASSVDRNIYIRKNGTNKVFPTGSILEISLKSTDNNLTGPENSKIPHTLTATINSNHAASAGNTSIGQNLILTGEGANSTSQTNQFATVAKATSVNVNLKSDIAANKISEATLEEGAYSNTSTLSVKFSKVPTVPGTAADSQSAVTSR